MWKLGERYEIIHDLRGDIIPVAEGDFKSVMVIESKKNAIRANHWHKTDAHVMYILSGRAIYYEEVQGVVTTLELSKGDSVFTGPGIPHAMEFLEDTVMVVCAKNARDTKAYLEDTVKCQLVS